MAPPDDVTDEDGESLEHGPTGGKSYKLEPHFPVTSKSSLSCIKFDPLNLRNVSTVLHHNVLKTNLFVPGFHKLV